MFDESSLKKSNVYQTISLMANIALLSIQIDKYKNIIYLTVVIAVAFDLLAISICFLQFFYPELFAILKELETTSIHSKL